MVELLILGNADSPSWFTRTQTLAKRGRYAIACISKHGINLAIELSHRSLPFSERMIHRGFAPQNRKLGKCQLSVIRVDFGMYGSGAIWEMPVVLRGCLCLPTAVA